MLKTYRIIPFVFILFLVLGFSFIALQVTTEDAEAQGGEMTDKILHLMKDNPGPPSAVCEPVKRIRGMRETGRHQDYILWVERCQVSGKNGNCGNRSVKWPAGDGGRCETIAAHFGDGAPGFCEPVKRIRDMRETHRHSDYLLWLERCQVSGHNGQCGNKGAQWPKGDGGRCVLNDSTAPQAAAAIEAARAARPANSEGEVTAVGEASTLEYFNSIPSEVRMVVDTREWVYYMDPLTDTLFVSTHGAKLGKVTVHQMCGQEICKR